VASGDDDIRDVVASEDFSLESILAEYKGTAYINGDKKTPPELLKEQIDSIVKEVTGRAERAGANAAPREIRQERAGGAPREGTPREGGVNAAPREIRQERAGGAPREGTPKESGANAAPRNDRTYVDQAAQRSQAGEEPQKPKETDKVLLFFDNYQSPTLDTQDSIVHDVEKAIEKELGYTDFNAGTRAGAQGSNDVFGRDGMFGNEQFEVEEPFAEEEEVFEEPDLRDAVKRFAAAYNSVSLRSIPAALITLLMVILTFAFEAGTPIPFGVGRSLSAASGALVITMLLVMMLCVDIIVRGAVNLVRGTLGAETLILFSCAFSFISGAFTIVNDSSGILPFCAVSAFSLTCAAFGEKYNLRAITETLKTALGSSEPYGVLAEFNGEINKSVLKKARDRVDGFYNNLVHPDVSENVYRYAAPVLLAAALLLSIISALAGGHGAYFLHILSALLAAAAPFSAMLAFSVPFGIVAKSIRRSGAAIAGWGGADDICFTDGACVTDDDLFPPGTLSFSGMKLYEGVSAEKAIRYTASLIVASGSGLSRIFSEALTAQGMKKIRVEDFACYEGGVGALIRGEQVMTGSAAFMNLLGIRIPDDMNMKNAVFTAVNSKLIAMFAINYVPVNSVQSALVSMLKWRINLFFAVRDFNVTPAMVSQKFKISIEDIESFQARDSYNISDFDSGKEGRMAAVLTREGLGPFAEAVTGGKLLKLSALITVALSVFSAVIGVLFMFFMCWSGAFMSAKPGNLLTFMLSMLAVVLVVCGYARLRK